MTDPDLTHPEPARPGRRRAGNLAILIALILLIVLIYAITLVKIHV